MMNAILVKDSIEFYNLMKLYESLGWVSIEGRTTLEFSTKVYGWQFPRLISVTDRFSIVTGNTCFAMTWRIVYFDRLVKRLDQLNLTIS